MHGFDVATAAQSAAFFIKEAGGKIDCLKLVKLMYLAEREFMKEYDAPLYYDAYVNMDHGPAPSTAINLIIGKSKDNEWSKFVGDLSGTMVKGRSGVKLNRLSEAEIGILKKLWKKFSNYSGYKLAAWTHDYCSEWQDPKGTPRNLSHATVFKALKKRNATALADDVKLHRKLRKVLSGA